MLISLDAKYVKNEEKNSGSFVKMAPATHPLAGISLWSELFQFRILDFITDLALGFFFSIRKLKQVLLSLPWLLHNVVYSSIHTNIAVSVFRFRRFRMDQREPKWTVFVKFVL
jgi:hypothetical protein